jgi:repressor LexA
MPEDPEMSRKQLTAKQHTFLEYLAEHVRKAKVWPTYREIVDHFGFRSPNSVTQNLQALARKGYLSREDDGYRLLGQGKGIAGGGFPVQGTVADGHYSSALSVEEVTLRDLFPGLETAFAVRMDQPVRGVDVRSGDYLLVEDAEPEAGAMLAVIARGQPAVCRTFPEEGALRLQYPDGEEVLLRPDADAVEFLGRYVGHINARGLARVPQPERTPA